MLATLRRAGAVALALAALPAVASAAAGSGGDPALTKKVMAAYTPVKSYKVVVLGSVKSTGIWNAPNKYQMATDFEGKTVQTVLIGGTYWTQSQGKWEKSGTASNSLAVDIVGLIASAKKANGEFVKLPDVTEDGKKVGTFSYTFTSGSQKGTQEVCNYDLSSYRATRCKADQLTLLYSAYNDPSLKVAKVQ